MLSLFYVIFLSYLVGSIPTSIIVAKLLKGIDIRQHGSGNAGGTNVIRVLGLKEGIFVIVFDIFKGFIATVFIAKLMYSPFPFKNLTPLEDFTLVQILAGSAAIVGHIWTVFGGFKGGKGMATATGMLIGLAPIDILIVIGVFTIVFIISRYISLGSISAAVAFPLTLFFRENIFKAEVEGYSILIFFSIGIAALLIFTHRANIKRLIEGREHKITNFHLFRKK
ncbi:MAG: glycerol-3-phosphate 1-O-acyltransferase PlsY [Bacteroidetes bacterium]|nr:glycerol-3-phosphate 1-O-acyltransferase PlsY [Bacteroidota bacterium]MBU1422816.1 glycerol-3-phosphate 1-O-acyltransferase PlsY [Bacteroidota bacterium]MBU2471800.1 glycerol-3-phosphate 1-O-acyltransferase PlsY [Bacteroidota bacterium]MBU2636656.1 glycerol-3-phosphate 1-O-acyltransferase PlsY [Bacteroidota bacterium]